MEHNKQHSLSCPCCHSTQLTADIWVQDNGDERAAVVCDDCGTQGYLHIWIARSDLAAPLKSLMIQMLFALKNTSGSVNLGLPRTSAENIARALAEIDPETAAQANMLCRGELGQAA